MQKMLFNQLKMLASTSMVLTFLQISIPQTVEGSEGVVVTLEKRFLERIIERNMQEALDNDPRLAGRLNWRGHPRVEVERSSRNSLAVKMRLRYSITGPNPNVDVNFRLGFSCWWRNPSLNLSVSHVNVDARISWLPIISDVILNRIVSGRTDGLQEEIASSVAGFDGGQFDTCPVIQVTSQGNVELQFVTGNQCRPGQTRHTPCPASHFGDGFNYQCVNGFWEQSGGWCEPSAPPGGHPR